MTFPIFSPYLKGFHLTLASHLPRRNANGWKLSNIEFLGHLELLHEKGLISHKEVQERQIDIGLTQQDPPSLILLVPRFYLCLKALWAFFQSPTPPLWSCRRKHIAFLVYGFNDMSKSGLGVTKLWDNKLTVSIGMWAGENLVTW